MEANPIRRTQARTRIRRFVFTLNNWTEEEYRSLTEDLAPTTTWLIIGKEKGENGTPHLQGACILGTQCSFSKLKTWTGLKRAHIETMRGKPEDSRVYCTKEDLDAFESGTLPQPGKRNDLRDACQKILTGATVRSVARELDGAVVVAKYFKGLIVVRSLNTEPRTDAPKVFWFWGPTGVGKTRSAFEFGATICKSAGKLDDDIWISSGGLRWFDGYDGQHVAIFDDFRAKHVTSFAYLLRLLDRYPVAVEFKGGSVLWIPKVIFITCPYNPRECFGKGEKGGRSKNVPEDLDQLERRITRIVEFTELFSDEDRGKLSGEITALL